MRRVATRGARLAAGLLAGAALLAACDVRSEKRLSKSEYELTVRSSYAPVQAAFRQTRGVPLAALGERIDVAQDRLRGAAEELEKAEPPTEVEEENEELVEGLREYAEDLDELREAAERGDAPAVAAFNARISTNEAVERIAEAAEEMKFKGYDLGPIAEE